MVEDSGIPSPLSLGGKIIRRWLARLLFDLPKKCFISCPTCGTSEDSLSVVCTKDSSILIGLNIDNRKRAYIVHAIRVTAVAVALAVGYLHLIWPIYLLVSIGVFTFFLLFHRNHRTARNYVIVLAVAGVLSAGLLAHFGTHGNLLTALLATYLIIVILGEQVFLVAFGRNITDDPRQEWLRIHRVEVPTGTLTWIALVLTFSLVNLATYVILTATETGVTLQFFSLDMVRISLGLAAISCLVSSTVFSLNGEPFSIPDRWHYKVVLTAKNLKRNKRLQYWHGNEPSGAWRERIVYTLGYIAAVATNRFIELLEHSYNEYVVCFANRLAQSVVRIANSTRRTAKKTYLHTLRTLRRFKVVAVWAVLWAIYVAKSYWKNFFFPISAILTCSILLFSIADDFFRYVHQHHVFLPLSIAWKALVVFILLTVSGSFVSHSRFLDFFERVLAAVSVFGPSVYLFFLLTDWILVLFGHLTGGPYRIGWITIICTVVLIIIFVRTQWFNVTGNPKGDAKTGIKEGGRE